jgi:hypothetical protein
MPKRNVKDRRRWQRDLAQQVQHHRGRPKPPEVSADLPKPTGYGVITAVLPPYYTTNKEETK